MQNSEDRPRSGFYEHELYSDTNGIPSALRRDQTGTADNPSSSRETINLLGNDNPDSSRSKPSEISYSPRQMINNSPS